MCIYTRYPGTQSGVATPTPYIDEKQNQGADNMSVCVCDIQLRQFQVSLDEQEHSADEVTTNMMQT